MVPAEDTTQVNHLDIHVHTNVHASLIYNGTRMYNVPSNTFSRWQGQSHSMRASTKLESRMWQYPRSKEATVCNE